MMIKEIKKLKSGFVILFAVTIAAILLSIALGVANISLKEIKFGTNARDTNDAFFAADTGLECALVNDKSTSTIFVSSPAGFMKCLGGNVTVTKIADSFWTFKLAGLGSANGCAIVTVDKTLSLDPDNYIFTSKGYSNGGGGSAPSWACNPGSNTVERQIELRSQI